SPQTTNNDISIKTNNEPSIHTNDAPETKLPTITFNGLHMLLTTYKEQGNEKEKEKERGKKSLIKQETPEPSEELWQLAFGEAIGEITAFEQAFPKDKPTIAHEDVLNSAIEALLALTVGVTLEAQQRLEPFIASMIGVLLRLVGKESEKSDRRLN